MGPTINVLSWNVRGLNCPDKRGNVKWVLRRCSSDVAILRESKMKVVTRSIAISLWGCRPVEWIHLPSVGRSGLSRHYYPIGSSNLEACRLLYRVIFGLL